MIEQEIPIGVNPNSVKYVTRNVDETSSYMALPELVRNGFQAPLPDKIIHLIDNSDKNNTIIGFEPYGSKPKTVHIFEMPIFYHVSKFTDAEFEYAKSNPIYTVLEDGEDSGIWVPKLVVDNATKGFDPNGLLHITNLGSTLCDNINYDRYGQGAKIACLKINKMALSFVSGLKDVITKIELVTRKTPEGNRYFKKIPLDITAQRKWEAQNAPLLEGQTDIIRKLWYSPNREFFQVIQEGNHPLQLTGLHPNLEKFRSIDKNGKPVLSETNFELVKKANTTSTEYWVLQNLADRFFNIPEDCNVEICSRLISAEARSNRNHIRRYGFKSLSTLGMIYTDWSKFYTNYECVYDKNTGVKVHYSYEPIGKKVTYQISDQKSQIAVVLDNEIVFQTKYGSPAEGRRWGQISSEFNIFSAKLAKQCSIIIELPKDFGVKMDGTRTRLYYNNDDASAFNVHDVADIVKNNMPQWLIDLNDSYMLLNKNTENIQDNWNKIFQDMLTQYNYQFEHTYDSKSKNTQDFFAAITNNGRNRSSSELGSGGSGDGRMSTKLGGNNPIITQSPTSNTKRPLPAIPKIPSIRVECLYTQEEVSVYGLEKRFACFNPLSDTIYVNMIYETLKAKEELIKTRLLNENKHILADQLEPLLRKASEDESTKIIFLYMATAMARKYNGDLDGWEESLHKTAITNVFDSNSSLFVSEVIRNIKRTPDFASINIKKAA